MFPIDGPGIVRVNVLPLGTAVYVVIGESFSNTAVIGDGVGALPLYVKIAVIVFVLPS
jgi:hypothetical protein